MIRDLRRELYGNGWRHKTILPSIGEGTLIIPMEQLKHAYEYILRIRRVQGIQAVGRGHLEILIKDMRNKVERIKTKVIFKQVERGNYRQMSHDNANTGMKSTLPRHISTYEKWATKYRDKADRLNEPIDELMKNYDYLQVCISDLERKMQQDY